MTPDSAGAARTRTPSTPPAAALSVRVTSAPDRVTLRAAGKLDVYTAPRMRRWLDSRDPASVRVVLDLADLTVVDSAGLRALLSLAGRAASGGRRPMLVGTAELAGLLALIGRHGDFDITLGTASGPGHRVALVPAAAVPVL